jgi:hypothetical protein
MAVSTAVSNLAARHRAAWLANGEPYQGALALDWANGQSISPSGASVASTLFDAATDRVVLVSPTAAVFITVAAAPVATNGGAGTLAIPAGYGVPVYVPAGMAIAAFGTATVSLIPALNLV